MSLRLFLATLALGWVTIANAGDPVAGQAKAEVCVACHGEGGAKPIANYPIIAGQHENYLRHSMLSYKDGTRSNAVMVQQMSELTLVDINNLAAYFATQPSPLN